MGCTAPARGPRSRPGGFPSLPPHPYSNRALPPPAPPLVQGLSPVSSSSSLTIEAGTPPRSAPHSPPGPPLVVALYCKFVGGGMQGSVDLCASVALVDECGHVLLDTVVKPSIPVTNYRSVPSSVIPVLQWATSRSCKFCPHSASAVVSAPIRRRCNGELAVLRRTGLCSEVQCAVPFPCHHSILGPAP